MSDDELKKPPLPNLITVRVDESTFRRVMAIAHKFANGSMSEVCRLSIETALDSVEAYYKARNELKKATLVVKVGDVKK